MDTYGKEVLLDLHYCDPKTFTRSSIKRYFIALCNLIDMERQKLVWWDDLLTPEGLKETEPHLVGTSAVQFIKTSNITIHTLDILKRVYLNIFSCKDFDELDVRLFSMLWFKGEVASFRVIKRV